MCHVTKQSSFVLLVWLQSRFQTSPLQPNFCHGLGLATGKHGHSYFTNRICSRIVEFMIKKLLAYGCLDRSASQLICLAANVG